MVKTLRQPVDPFKLALQRMSGAQLQKLVALYKKRTPSAPTKDDLVNVLSTTMLRDQKLDAMRRFILAGIVSMAMAQFVDKDQVPVVEPDFDVASRVPKIVSVGEPDALFDGLTHIVWALIIGKNDYIDEDLQLREAQEADTIDSFYDSTSRILQIRASSSVAVKITGQWALKNGVDPDDAIRPIGIRDITQFEEFVTFINGSIRKCKGHKHESKGFDKVSGELDPALQDLRGTADYEAFLREVDTTDADLAYTFKKKPVKVGFGFGSRTTIFRTLEPEEVWNDVYKKLKKFFKQ